MAMAVALPFIMIAATALSAVGQMQQADAAEEAANFTAGQQEQRAGQERAVSQRRAIEARRQSKVLGSRALAVAGARGAGVSDPTVVNEIADIDRVGEYNALTALFEGEETGRGLEQSAANARRTGIASAQAARLSAAGTALNGATSFYERYGGGDFDSDTSNSRASIFSVKKA